MKFFESSRNNLIVLFLLFVAAEYFVFPVGEFALNDDWSYAHSVKLYIESGKIDLGYWPAMTLYSHILWGKLICQLFGFSFFTLRLPTLILAFSGAVLLYQLLVNLKCSQPKSLLLSIFILFNPLVFSLSNSFMTDVPFMFSIILCFFSVERYANTNKMMWLVILCLSFIYSVMLRQYALGAGFALFVTWLIQSVLKKERKMTLILIPIVVLFVTYWFFDKWRINNASQASNYITGELILNKDVIENLLGNIVSRYYQIVLFVGLFFFPFLMPAAIRFFKQATPKDYFFIVPAFIVLTWFIKKELFSFPIGNVFYNCGLGPVLLVDITLLNQNQGHSVSTAFNILVKIFGLSGALLINFCLPAGITQLIRRFRNKKPTSFFSLFLLCFAFIFLIMLSYTDSFFDRYVMPVMTVAALFLSKTELHNKPIKILVAIYMTTTIIFSTLATRDFFSLNTIRYELISETEQKGVDPLTINGGLEYVAYRFYSLPWWAFWADNQATYFVTCGKIKDYNQVGFKTYKRWLPYKTDTLFLYKKPL